MTAITQYQANTSVPQIANIYCTEALSARYWAKYRAMQSGWMLVENLSTHDTIRVHFNEAGNDDSNYKEVKPLHSKPFQVDEGDLLWFSSGVANGRVRIENAKYKPVIDEYYQDEAMVENVPFYDDAVGATTTYDCTTLAKGYATYFQVVGEVGGFTGTVEFSSDNAVTYCPAITLDTGDPNKTAFEETRVITHIRVTRTGGTYAIYYR
jgi:hypothetical protein